jgi:hypothetical protein
MGRDRDDRVAFTAADLTKALELPIWRGYRGDGARLKPLTVAVQDGLCWASLIAVCSLMLWGEIQYISAIAMRLGLSHRRDALTDCRL